MVARLRSGLGRFVEYHIILCKSIADVPELRTSDRLRLQTHGDDNKGELMSEKLAAV